MNLFFGNIQPKMMHFENLFGVEERIYLGEICEKSLSFLLSIQYNLGRRKEKLDAYPF
jgi:hypothetical protein